MRTYLECIPCIIEQTLKVSREMTQDERKQQKLLQMVMATLSRLSYNNIWTGRCIGQFVR
jgi:uncharacterized protein with ATP-grasp and redox domains